jgi:hypothetical protein
MNRQNVEVFYCETCKRSKFEQVGTHSNGVSITTGYGYDERKKPICYECCAEGDKRFMREKGKITLYLCESTPIDGVKRYVLSNWPGSFKIKLNYVRKGRHNIAGTRYDFRFSFEGYIWHGVQYGEMTQIAHCKKTKEKSHFSN